MLTIPFTEDEASKQAELLMEDFRTENPGAEK